MAEPSWKLDYVNSRYYLDERGNAVQGYEVGIMLLPYNSPITFNVPDDEPTLIAQIAQERLDRRVKLEEMANGG